MAIDLRLVLKGIEVRAAGTRPRDQQGYTHIQVVDWERLGQADDPAAAVLAAVAESIERVADRLKAMR
ncbi:hypothetical protein ACQVP2_07475 [Methylobacterium aquaticum]|uniref:hypothetical protein n=1 Tax=Methylobacterium aquaticum TaxID=270351 RepID=UPI003D184AD5